MNWINFVVAKFYCMPLLMVASAFRLRRRCWSLLNSETAGSGRVSIAVAHLPKRRLGTRWRLEDAITDRSPGAGDLRPAVGRGRLIGRNLSDLSCFLYRGKLKRPHMHCRADAVA